MGIRPDIITNLKKRIESLLYGRKQSSNKNVESQKENRKRKPHGRSIYQCECFESQKENRKYNPNWELIGGTPVVMNLKKRIERCTTP